MPIRFFFTCILLSAACSIVFGAGLCWDGAYLLFKVLDERVPFVPLFRYGHIALQAPVFAAQQAGIEDLRILRPLFAAPYALVPLASLALSWWVVRARRPRLFIWPVLSMTLANLPGAFFLASEGPISTALFWPIVLALLVGRVDRVPLALSIVCAALVAFLHPIAVPLFAAAGILAFVLFARRRPPRGWILPALGLAFLAIALAKSRAPLTDYEAKNLSIAHFLETFRTATWGWPRVSLAFTLVATLLIALQPMFLSRMKGKGGRGVLLYAPALLALAAGAAIVPWARYESRWASALNYRFVMNTLSAGFLTLAALEGLLDRRPADSAPDPDPILKARIATARAAALSFLLLFVVQGLSWRALCERFLREVSASPAPCVSLPTLRSARSSALAHWGAASLSIVLQGREPARIALSPEGCEELTRGELRVAPWDHRTLDRGWFKIPR